MSKTFITSRDSRGQQASRIFEAAYDKAKIDYTRAERLEEGRDELELRISELIAELSAPDRYADEEVISNHTYPEEYSRRPIEEQIESTAKLLDLNPRDSHAFAESLPKLPEDAEGWFAIPSVVAVARKHFPWVTDSAEQYCRVQSLILQKIAKSRLFHNYCEKKMTPQSLQVHEHTARSLGLITEVQKGDILIIAAQLGMHHRGRSVRRAREMFAKDEFGLDGVIVGTIALTHPERFVHSEELDIDCAGAKFKPNGWCGFSHAPLFYFGDQRFGFGADGIDLPNGRFSSASAFLTR